MADEILIFDKAASLPDGTDPGSPLSVGPGTNYNLVSYSYPAPPLNVLYTSSIDTEGESPVTNRHGNRVINLEFELAVDATDAILKTLQGKFGKLQREGGTLHRTMKNGDVRIYDIIAADGWDPTYDFAYVLADMAHVTMSLPAKPYARGTEVDLGDNVETTLPALVFTETGVAGDVPALGRLVIDNDAAADQWWVTWGLQSENYSSAATAALFYEAEGRTALGGSATAVGSGTPSGAGSNVMRNTALITAYQAILSTQATGGGAHLSHVGTFNVYMRLWTPTTNTGTTTVAFEWGEGDFRRFTRNTPVVLRTSLQGSWTVVNVGTVTLSKVLTGTQRWEGRLLAKSTVLTDTLDIDWIMLVPADEGSGVLSAVSRMTTPTSLSVREDFDQAAGALTAKALPVGGTWAGAGSANDFTVTGTPNFQARRTAVSDASNVAGRFALAGATTYTTIQAAASFLLDVGAVVSAGNNPFSGLLLRYVDTNNWAAAGRIGASGNTTGYLVFQYAVAGVMSYVYARNTYGLTYGDPALAPGTPCSLSCSITSAGQYTVAVNGITKIQGSSGTFATGGTLASGRVGLYDCVTQATWPARTFDSLWAAVPPLDAAMFASQSCEIRHNAAIREDSTGSFWARPSNYTGDYLMVPPAMAEARTTRMIVTASRGAPGTGADTTIDDISARLFVTPRYL